MLPSSKVFRNTKKKPAQAAGLFCIKELSSTLHTHTFNEACADLSCKGKKIIFD